MLAETVAESVVDESIVKPKRVHLTVVTDSELQAFRSCHRKHHYQYRERLRPMIDGKALAIGSIFHSGMSSGLRAGWANRSLPNEQRLAAEIAAACENIDALVVAWASKIVEHGTGVDFEKLNTEVVKTAAMVKWMLTHYFISTVADLSNLVLVETEMAFRVDLHNKRGHVAPHLKYEGVRDAVFYDPDYNQLVLHEHKTAGGDPRQIEKRVEMDSQTKGYLYALKQQRATMKAVDGTPMAGAHLGRVAYNVLRKSLPHAPKVNQNGAVSVAACDTTADMYADALREQVEARKIPVAIKQQEFLDGLRTRGDTRFARIEHHQTASEIETWRNDTVVDAARIREANRDPSKRTRNPGNCNMAWSLPCTYRSVCLDDTPGIRKTFRISADSHAEVRNAEIEADATQPAI